MKTKKVFIVHGYSASPESHWFPWLKSKIEESGGSVSILRLPNSANPKAGEWNDTLKKEITQLDENTLLLGHSLGCVTILNYLSELPEQTRIGGLICVAGFSENLPNIPEIDEFTDKKYNVNLVNKIALNRTVIVSDNDEIVAPELTKQLALELNAPLYHIENGGHFLGSEGFTEFTLVLKEIQRVLQLP